jgi:AraC-like DNA-binding protein
MRNDVHTPGEVCSTVELSASTGLKQNARPSSFEHRGESEAIRLSNVASDVDSDVDLKRDEREQRETARRIDGCVQFMMQHLDARLKIATLSARAGLSDSYFYSLFKRATGYSPGNFLIRARMHRACELLTETRLKVKEVAALLGYSDQFYFSRQFKAVTRLTPSEYRGTVTDSTTTQSGAPFNSGENEPSKHFINRFVSVSKNFTPDQSNGGMNGRNFSEKNGNTNGNGHSLHGVVVPTHQSVSSANGSSINGSSINLSSANKAVATVKQNPKP